ncbi:MAG: hypothetical protein IT442_06240 [Phycisphaeraceae bacterium]|nr:hypothetical protein [Phycisphaeraceae bacterium]
MLNHPWMLAASPNQDWIEIVTYAIGGVIVVGGWVINHLRQMAEKRAAEERARRKLEEITRQGGTPTASGRPQKLPTADDLAMRRRQQLQELAQQRRQAAGQPRQATPKPEPDNLTLSQARERQRAVEAYRRRAEALEQQRHKQSARRDPPTSLSQQKPASPRPIARKPQPATSPVPSHQFPIRERHEIAQRHIASAVNAVATRHIHSQLESPAQHAALTSPMVADTRHIPFSLRQAILWKEILDPPVGLRETHLV